MTGWRLGWMVMPEDMMRAVERMAQNLFISAPTLSQLAGVAAFDCDEELKENIAKYAANRELLLKNFRKPDLINWPRLMALFISMPMSLS